ncbi:hypothetical protein [Metabacillus sp. Hm71]|uniref:hypothetical protein n=1 Tax=Metabacillus sp. Hm71 TaxID=3450743 RepID=UPI003F433E82
MNNNSHKKVLIDLIFIIIQIICIIGLMLTGSIDFMRMAITDLIFWLIYMIVEYKQKWIIPIYVRIVVMLSIISNVYLGELFFLCHFNFI